MCAVEALSGGPALHIVIGMCTHVRRGLPSKNIRAPSKPHNVLEEAIAWEPGKTLTVTLDDEALWKLCSRKGCLGSKFIGQGSHELGMGAGNQQDGKMCEGEWFKPD